MLLLFQFVLSGEDLQGSSVTTVGCGGARTRGGGDRVECFVAVVVAPISSSPMDPPIPFGFIVGTMTKLGKVGEEEDGRAI